jgi:hypothetical protein
MYHFAFFDLLQLKRPKPIFDCMVALGVVTTLGGTAAMRLITASAGDDYPSCLSLFRQPE